MTTRRIMRPNRLVAIVAVLAAVSLATVPVNAASAPPSGTDQITGNGSTASAVTATWAQGLLGADNKTVVQPRDTSGPESFMDPEFQNLKVTVGQTQDLVHQAVTVDWSGFTTPADALGASPDFLQIMQCYGDATTGPNPEDCEFGTNANLLPTQLGNSGSSAGSRTGELCPANSTPSTTNPPGGTTGCDPAEPVNATHQAEGAADSYYVPFVPAGTDELIGDVANSAGQLSDFFDQFTTNEVQYATTNSDGSGQLFFETLTNTEAPGLGCGQLEPTGDPRDCWLVVVPRGQFDPNGFKLRGGASAPTAWPQGSPLSASNWAQRIQIHLGFAPIAPNCPIGSTDELETVGTELAAHAVFSWQLALNAAARCEVIFGYSQTPESTSTTQLTSQLTPGVANAGLAFTTIPIGSEAARDGSPPGPAAKVVYAPVAVSATTFGFNINLPSSGGVDTTPVKLTPRLLAKALTQSYRLDLPDVAPSQSAQGPTWAQHNPLNITADPEFQKLNPDVSFASSGGSLAPLLTEDHSGVNQQVWQWILADPAARKWLSGTPDQNGMVVNPNYRSATLNVSKSAIDSYPRADPTCFVLGQSNGKDEQRCSLDLLPYVQNLGDGAQRVRAANNPESPGWSTDAVAPDGTSGWWLSGSLEGVGGTMMWAATDSADLANFGLVPASLCDANGNNCVTPNTASVAAALNTSKADSSGLLHVNPATPGKGGYPLVDVTYAAVRTDQDAVAKDDYAALIIFADDNGQVPGVGPGQLPHGYLPLPDVLRVQGICTAAKLTGGGCTSQDPPTHPAGGTGGTSGQTSLPGGGSTTGLPGSTSNLLAHAPGGAAAKGKAAAGGPSGVGQQPAALTKSTKGTPAGAVRWVLLVVLIVGCAGAASGGLLRSRNVWPSIVGRFRR